MGAAVAASSLWRQSFVMLAILCQDVLQWGINLRKWVRAGTDQLGFLLQGRNGVGKQIEQINFATD